LLPPRQSRGGLFKRESSAFFLLRAISPRRGGNGGKIDNSE